MKLLILATTFLVAACAGPVRFAEDMQFETKALGLRIPMDTATDGAPQKAQGLPGRGWKLVCPANATVCSGAVITPHYDTRTGECTGGAVNVELITVPRHVDYAQGQKIKVQWDIENEQGDTRIYEFPSRGEGIIVKDSQGRPWPRDEFALGPRVSPQSTQVISLHDKPTADRPIPYDYDIVVRMRIGGALCRIDPRIVNRN